MKHRVTGASARSYRYLLFSYGLGSRVHTLEADLVEGGVVTNKPTTPEDTIRDMGFATSLPRDGSVVAKRQTCWAVGGVACTSC